MPPIADSLLLLSLKHVTYYINAKIKLIFPLAYLNIKSSIVKPKIDPSIVKNYRPISLLNTLSKLFEKCVFDNLYPYLITNKLLSPINSGFIKHYGAINRLIALVDSINKGFDNKQDSHLISLDISKAFDLASGPTF